MLIILMTNKNTLAIRRYWSTFVIVETQSIVIIIILSYRVSNTNRGISRGLEYSRLKLSMHYFQMILALLF